MRSGPADRGLDFGRRGWRTVRGVVAEAAAGGDSAGGIDSGGMDSGGASVPASTSSGSGLGGVLGATDAGGTSGRGGGTGSLGEVGNMASTTSSLCLTTKVRPHLHLTRLPSQSEGKSVQKPQPQTTLIDMGPHFTC